MKYIAQRFFNEYRPGDIVVEPVKAWIDSGLVSVVEEVGVLVNEDPVVEALDPEKKVNKKK
jgi:hypothetical protein